MSAPEPGLRIEPVLDHLSVDGEPGILDDTATYWTRFTNTGNVTLTDITVGGNMAGVDACHYSQLAPGQSYVCRSTRHIVTTTDAERGSFIPVVTATGTTPSGETSSHRATGEVLTVRPS